MRYVGEVVLFEAGGAAASDAVRWAELPEPALKARVLPLPPGALIEIADGSHDIVDAAVMRLWRTDASGSRRHFERLADLTGSLENARDLVILFALVFVALHEAAHLLGGHLDALNRDYRTRSGVALGYEERRSGEEPAPVGDALPFPLFHRMAELEADGAAIALLMPRAQAIATMLPGVDAIEDSGVVLVRRSAMTGAVLAILALDGAGSGNALYPMPVVRLLNAAAAAARVSLPVSFPTRDGDYVRPEMTNRDILIASGEIVGTVEPAFLAGLRILPLGARSARGVHADLRTALSLGIPKVSRAGSELARLSRYRSAFMRRLATDRRTSLW